MKRFLSIISIIVLFSACDKEIDFGDIDTDRAYKYLSNLNVSDAKIIYQRESAIQSVDNKFPDPYWKTDLSGNNSNLVITDETGTKHNIDIWGIDKLSDQILILSLNSYDILTLLYPGKKVSASEERFFSLVHVQTGKIYKCPKELCSDYFLKREPYPTDAQGNVYIASDVIGESRQIYKLNVSNMSIQYMLPDNTMFYDFEVSKNGFICYRTNSGDWMVKSPNNNLYTIPGVAFLFDNQIYSIENNKIYLWNITNNNIEKKEICPFIDCIKGYERPILYNTVRNTVVFKGLHMDSNSNDAKYIEFDGQTLSEIPEISSKFRKHNQDFCSTSQAWYSNEEYIVLHKLDMQTYQETSLYLSEYELYEIQASPNSSNLLFAGFQDSDNKSIIGTITVSDNISINNRISNWDKAINLIPLKW